MNLSQIGEFGLIQRLQNQLETRAGTQIGIGDDCAVLNSLQTPAVTMDALVEDVHFRRDWTLPRALGRKAMAVNISDLAASGARPIAAFVSLALGARDDWEFIAQLYAGFEDAAREFGFTIAGGDTTQSRGGLMLSIALVGEVIDQKRGPILRSGAQIGDVLLVSGTLGDAAAGLEILQAREETLNDAQISQISAAARDYLLKRHHEPTPRLELMKKLLDFDAQALHAALDLSDGLAGDAAHLARSSGVVAQFEAEKLPISAFCREAAIFLGRDAHDLALSGGEDYELLLAVAPEKVPVLLQNFRSEGFFLSEVGKCLAVDTKLPDTKLPDGEVVVLEHGQRRDFARGWTHF